MATAKKDTAKKAPAKKSQEKKESYNKKNAWLKYKPADIEKLEALCEEYKDFISVAKTERECVDRIVELAEAEGYKDLAKAKKIKAGDKLYCVNKGKAIVLFVIGTEALEGGMNILGAHIDSPRLDLKQNPLYEDTEIALLDTHYYGGIKKYQWVATPMALHGVVCKKDGTTVKVVIGEDENDPVFEISDLLIHLSGDQMQKPASKVIEGEDLNVTVGSRPVEGEEKETVKANILKLLKDKYDFDEDDFISAEIEVVPAGRARDLGLDRALIMGYGHDDRVCAFTSAKAIFAMNKPARTSACILVDKEEIGSVGASGMQSMFFENMLAEIMEKMGCYSDLALRRALQNSFMLSSDVNAAFDPNFPGVMEKKNCAYFGRGMAFAKYTGSRGKSGSNDASPEFIAKLRGVLEDNEVNYHFAELGKVDQGGGGTIAYIMAKYNMEVVDSGVALQNMHAPWEVVSKADVYEATNGYIAFLKNVK